MKGHAPGENPRKRWEIKSTEERARAEDQTERQQHTSYRAALSVSNHTSNLGSDLWEFIQIQGSSFVYNCFTEQALNVGSSSQMGEYVETARCRILN